MHTTGSDAGKNEAVLSAVSDNQKSNEPDGDLGAELFQRFTKGVQQDGWKVIALGSARSMSLERKLAKELGLIDLDKVVLLIAERP